MINLDRKSWHYRLYSIFYDNYGLPANLCPYFWKVIFALVFSWVFIPFYLIGKLSKKCGVDGDAPKFVVGVCTVAVIWIVIGMIGMWWHLHKQDSWSLILQVGGTIGFILIILVVLFSWGEHRKERRESRSEKPKPSLVKEFIKAKYNRYCPKITWK